MLKAENKELYPHIITLLEFTYRLLTVSTSTQSYNSLDVLVDLLFLDDWEIINYSLNIILLLSSRKEGLALSKFPNLESYLYYIAQIYNLQNPKNYTYLEMLKGQSINTSEFEFAVEGKSTIKSIVLDITKFEAISSNLIADQILSSNDIPITYKYALQCRVRLCRAKDILLIINCAFKAYSICLLCKNYNDKADKRKPLTKLIPNVLEILKSNISLETSCEAIKLITHYITSIKKSKQEPASTNDITDILNQTGFNSQNGYMHIVLRDITSLQGVNNNGKISLKSNPEKITSELAESTQYLSAFLDLIDSFSFMLTNRGTSVCKSAITSSLFNLLCPPIDNQYVYPFSKVCMAIQILITIMKNTIEDISSLDIVIQRICSELDIFKSGVTVSTIPRNEKENIDQGSRLKMVKMLFKLLLGSVILNTQRNYRNINRQSRVAMFGDMYNGDDQELEENDNQEQIDAIPEDNGIPGIPNVDQHQQTVASSRKVLETKLFDKCCEFMDCIRTTEQLDNNMSICGLIMKLFATIMSDIPTSIQKMIECGYAKVVLGLMKIPTLSSTSKYIISRFKFIDSLLINKLGDELIDKDAINNIFKGYECSTFGQWLSKKSKESLLEHARLIASIFSIAKVSQNYLFIGFCHEIESICSIMRKLIKNTKFDDKETVQIRKDHMSICMCIVFIFDEFTEQYRSSDDRTLIESFHKNPNICHVMFELIQLAIIIGTATPSLLTAKYIKDICSMGPKILKTVFMSAAFKKIRDDFESILDKTTQCVSTSKPIANINSGPALLNLLKDKPDISAENQMLILIITSQIISQVSQINILFEKTGNINQAIFQFHCAIANSFAGNVLKKLTENPLAIHKKLLKPNGRHYIKYIHKCLKDDRDIYRAFGILPDNNDLQLHLKASFKNSYNALVQRSKHNYFPRYSSQPSEGALILTKILEEILKRFNSNNDTSIEYKICYCIIELEAIRTSFKNPELFSPVFMASLDETDFIKNLSKLYVLLIKLPTQNALSHTLSLYCMVLVVSLFGGLIEPEDPYLFTQHFRKDGSSLSKSKQILKVMCMAFNSILFPSKEFPENWSTVKCLATEHEAALSVLLNTLIKHYDKNSILGVLKLDNSRSCKADPKLIDEMLKLGFQRKDVIHSLIATENNYESAVNLLIDERKLKGIISQTTSINLESTLDLCDHTISESIIRATFYLNENSAKAHMVLISILNKDKSVSKLLNGALLDYVTLLCSLRYEYSPNVKLMKSIGESDSLQVDEINENCNKVKMQAQICCIKEDCIVLLVKIDCLLEMLISFIKSDTTMAALGSLVDVEFIRDLICMYQYILGTSMNGLIASISDKILLFILLLLQMENTKKHTHKIGICKADKLDLLMCISKTLKGFIEYHAQSKEETKQNANLSNNTIASILHILAMLTNEYDVINSFIESDCLKYLLQLSLTKDLTEVPMSAFTKILFNIIESPSLLRSFMERIIKGTISAKAKFNPEPIKLSEYIDSFKFLYKRDSLLFNEVTSRMCEIKKEKDKSVSYITLKSEIPSAMIETSDIDSIFKQCLMDHTILLGALEGVCKQCLETLPSQIGKVFSTIIDFCIQNKDPKSQFQYVFKTKDILECVAEMFRVYPESFALLITYSINSGVVDLVKLLINEILPFGFIGKEEDKAEMESWESVISTLIKSLMFENTNFASLLSTKIRDYLRCRILSETLSLLNTLSQNSSNSTPIYYASVYSGITIISSMLLFNKSSAIEIINHQIVHLLINNNQYNIVTTLYSLLAMRYNQTQTNLPIYYCIINALEKISKVVEAASIDTKISQEDNLNAKMALPIMPIPALDSDESRNEEESSWFNREPPLFINPPRRQVERSDSSSEEDIPRPDIANEDSENDFDDNEYSYFRGLQRFRGLISRRQSNEPLIRRARARVENEVAANDETFGVSLDINEKEAKSKEITKIELSSFYYSNDISALQKLLRNLLKEDIKPKRSLYGSTDMSRHLLAMLTYRINYEIREEEIPITPLTDILTKNIDVETNTEIESNLFKSVSVILQEPIMPEVKPGDNQPMQADIPDPKGLDNLIRGSIRNIVFAPNSATVPSNQNAPDILPLINPTVVIPRQINPDILHPITIATPVRINVPQNIINPPNPLPQNNPVINAEVQQPIRIQSNIPQIPPLADILASQGIDESVFNELPQELKNEVINQARAQIQPPENNAQEREIFLASLPEDVRAEVLDQERRVSNPPPEIDNATFIETLSPELREEVLLSAEPEFLNSLPRNLIEEAETLRARMRRRRNDDRLEKTSKLATVTDSLVKYVLNKELPTNYNLKESFMNAQTHASLESLITMLGYNKKTKIFSLFASLCRIKGDLIISSLMFILSYYQVYEESARSKGLSFPPTSLLDKSDRSNTYAVLSFRIIKLISYLMKSNSGIANLFLNDGKSISLLNSLSQLIEQSKEAFAIKENDTLFKWLLKLQSIVIYSNSSIHLKCYLKLLNTILTHLKNYNCLKSIDKEEIELLFAAQFLENHTKDTLNMLWGTMANLCNDPEKLTILLSYGKITLEKYIKQTIQNWTSEQSIKDDNMEVNISKIIKLFWLLYTKFTIINEPDSSSNSNKATVTKVKFEDDELVEVCESKDNADDSMSGKLECCLINDAILSLFAQLSNKLKGIHSIYHALKLSPLIECLFICFNPYFLASKKHLMLATYSKYVKKADKFPSNKCYIFIEFAISHKYIINKIIRNMKGEFISLLKPIIECLPWILEFDIKKSYFRSQIRQLRSRGHHEPIYLDIRRNNVFMDSFAQLNNKKAEDWKGPFKVSFTKEDAVDAGGVTREWYSCLSKAMFNPGIALFKMSPNGNTYLPDYKSVVVPDHLKYFKFIGRIIGKALVDGNMLDCFFTKGIYKMMVNQPLTQSDMDDLDPAYYKNLRWILENNCEALGLTFSYETDYFGKTQMRDLDKGGSTKPVTEQNKHEYVLKMCKAKLYDEIRLQITALLEGLYELIPHHIISIFDYRELEFMISGLPDIDVADLQVNTEYMGYTKDSPVIVWLWELIEELSQSERAEFLQFVTGTSRVPLGGFKNLQGTSGLQRFQIQKAYGKENLLPRAHTWYRVNIVSIN